MTMVRQIKKFEKLLTKTGGCSKIQSGGAGKNQDSNGAVNTTVETTQTINTEEVVTSTTTAYQQQQQQQQS